MKPQRPTSSSKTPLLTPSKTAPSPKAATSDAGSQAIKTPSPSDETASPLPVALGDPPEAFPNLEPGFLNKSNVSSRDLSRLHELRGQMQDEANQSGSPDEEARLSGSGVQ